MSDTTDAMEWSLGAYEGQFDAFEQDLRDYNKGKEVFWTTKDGTDIPLSTMSDMHIERCIKFFSDNPIMEYWITIFKKELQKRKI